MTDEFMIVNVRYADEKKFVYKIDSDTDFDNYIANDSRSLDIIEISFMQCVLNNKLPTNIYKLTNLKKLSCTNTNLKEISPEIGNLINLEELNFDQTLLENLPKEIGNLTKLQFLSCTNTQVRDMPDEITNLPNLYIYN